MKTILLIFSLFIVFTPLNRITAQSDTCTYVVDDNVIPLYSAPLNIASLQIDVLQVGGVYTVEKRAERYLYVSGDGLEGWVHGLSLGAHTEGDCASLVDVDAPLTDYQVVCFFTPVETMPVFNDPALTEQHPVFGLQSGQSYPVVYEDESSLFAYIDDASGGWVSGDTGFLSGTCDSLPTPDSYPQTAIALENARLWSQPDVSIGDIIADIAPGTPLQVISGPVQGPIRLDTDDLGLWFYVSDGDQSGWLWEARLEFEEIIGDDDREMIQTLDDVRLWSLPDVQQGHMIAFVNPGSTVRVLEGPVVGPIRFDTADTGNWHFVEVGSTRGWIWEARLEFDN